jgi:general secretion pathway protein K
MSHECLVSALRENREHGVALITVMLILALATILAVSMSSRQQLNIHRSSNIFNFEQAYQYISGAESWAQQILKRDRKKNDLDSFKDDWAQVLPPLPIEGGSMAGQIEDLQARFNINTLVLDGKPQVVNIERFKRLLQNLGLNENLPNVIVDWIDSNELAGFSGAEDNEYLNLTPAYRSANKPMQDISELLLIKGFDFASYEKLRPFVCVLESATDINVNTASAEVLSSLASGLNIEDARSLVAERDKTSYEKIEDFLQQPLILKTEIKKDGLSVNSHYFQLNSTAQIDNINVEYTSILQRDSDVRVIVLKRSRGVL